MASAPTNLTADLAETLSAWHLVQDQLAKLKQQELWLRNILLASELFPQNEGTRTIALYAGWKLEGDKPMRYSVNASKVADFETLCIQQGLKQLYDDLLRWKPEVSVKVFKSVLPIAAAKSPELTKAVYELITVKPGQGQLKLIAPEEK